MGQLIIQPDAATGKDTYIRSISPNTNYGASSTIKASWFPGTGAIERFLAQYDISSLPAGQVINSAYLEFTRQSFKNYKIVYCYKIDTAWLENTVTYNNQPSFSTLITSKSMPATGSIIFTVTTAIQNWYDGTWVNNGMIFKTDETDTVDVWCNVVSSDHSVANQRPKLTINYSIAPPSISGNRIIIQN